MKTGITNKGLARIAQELKDQIPGGLADKSKKKDFDKDQLLKGLKVELEHTDDPKIALEIAMDHLVEHPKYYDHLAEMEDNW